MKTLQQLYEEHKIGDWPDKGSIHSYLEIYEEILAPYRLNPDINILEVGLMSGESLRMWAEYFKGNVYGIDCDLKPINGMADLTKVIAEGYDVVIGDAANPADVAKYFPTVKFRVVIEDANHDVSQQVQIYNTLKPYLNKGAIYCIEDIQDIDATKKMFQDIDHTKSVEIFDMRKEKDRYDDVLVVIRDKWYVI